VQVSVPSIRDVDTINTLDSQQKVMDDCLTLIMPGTSNPGRTMVTQYHLHDIQCSIFLSCTVEGQEWCDSSGYGFDKIPNAFHGERIDFDV
jgi:hypothetical protein